jgi:hypothetical protein
VAADPTYSKGEFLRWLMERNITPYLCTWDLGDPSSPSVLVWFGSRLLPPPSTQTATRPAAVQTNAHARWLPSPHVPWLPTPLDRDKTSPPSSRCSSLRSCNSPVSVSTKQFVGSPGGNRILIMIIVRLLSPEPFGWLASPKFTRASEPKLSWNHFTTTKVCANNPPSFDLLSRCFDTVKMKTEGWPKQLF